MQFKMQTSGCLFVLYDLMQMQFTLCFHAYVTLVYVSLKCLINDLKLHYCEAKTVMTCCSADLIRHDIIMILTVFSVKIHVVVAKIQFLIISYQSYVMQICFLSNCINLYYSLF